MRPERFELPTCWFEARRSIQLSYGRTCQLKGVTPLLYYRRGQRSLMRHPRGFRMRRPGCRSRRPSVSPGGWEPGSPTIPVTTILRFRTNAFNGLRAPESRMAFSSAIPECGGVLTMARPRGVGRVLGDWVRIVKPVPAHVIGFELYAQAIGPQDWVRIVRRPYPRLSASIPVRDGPAAHEQP